MSERFFSQEEKMKHMEGENRVSKKGNHIF